MSVAYDLSRDYLHELDPDLTDPDLPAGGAPTPRLRLLAPTGTAPDRVPGARPAASAEVLVLHAPRSVAPPLRLTRRGVAVLALAVAALAVGLVWAAASSRGASGAATGTQVGSAATVTVRPGDTLWSIASRVAPAQDPRAEVDALRHVNHLAGVGLEPGQVLRLH